MPERSFVHLHCHSHYSLLDGANRIPELVAQTKALGMNAVALTDHGNLYGAIEFYRECKAAGINPVVGYEAYVAPTRRNEREARRRGDAGFHLTLLAKNRTGFRNLVKLASLAFLEGYHYVPRIDKEILEAHKEGLICLSGCASSEFSEFILRDQLAEATRLAEWFQRVFRNDFYVEIQNNGLQIQETCAAGAIDIARKIGSPLVATCDAHYLCQADAVAHDVLLCINTGKTFDDPNRMRYGSDLFYVRGPQEMYKLFPEHADAIQRSQEIADSVDIDLDFKARHFPVFTPPVGKTPEQHLRELCQAGMRDRFGEHPSQTVLDRLELELGIICRMGFAGYFLIVSDFVRFAVDNKIPCSARGSACGALVSFVLKLSHVDPLEYDLLFERFLDPNRSEAPDIDIDFCQDRREEVIHYVKQKYGEASVAQIATFGTMAARAAIKDVGRVLQLPLERVVQLTKMIPQVLGITLEEALEQSTDFKAAYDGDPDVRRVIDIAIKLEGTNRNAGTHAAGVVISNGPLTDYVPLQRVVRKGDDAGNKQGEVAITTQWGMGDLEKVGMLKMDFLGLRTLTLLDNCCRLLEKTRGIRIDLYRLPLDDGETYALLQRGDAKGVFQLESDGIRELLKRLRPDNFRDIIALMALYRPGPLEGGMVDSYVNCKHGREKPHYAHPVMEEVLAETHAVMVYQEQVMRILNRLGGIELSSAYACIKAISKKKHDVIDQRRVEFIQGARARGLDEETAREIFEKIVLFGGYGFNKCLVGSTTLVDAQTGEQTTMKELFVHRKEFQVHALGEDGRLRSRRVEDVVWNGRKRVYELKTAQGKRIVATSNHPFRTLDGWTLLRDLKPGDRIAAPRVLSVPTTTSWPRHEIIALAGLLAEGNTCHPTSLYFFGNDRQLVNDFAEAAGCFPDSVARIYQRKDRLIYEVCVNTGRNARFLPGQKPWNDKSRTLGNVAVFEASPKRSGAFSWAKELGILGRKATDKRVPSGVFRLCDSDLELFLGRLWAGDGFIANNADQFVPYYATSSSGMARDVQTLLLRLGILSGVHEKEFKYRGTVRPGYTVHLFGENTITQFAQRILPHAVGREEQTTLLLRRLDGLAVGRSNKDTIPPEVRTWVHEERHAAGLTWVELEQQSGVCVKEFLGNAIGKKRGFRRSTIARLAKFFGSKRLADLASSEVFWDTILSIEPKGIEDTYDLTVEADHNFVADGLIVHNSHTAAYAQLGYQTAYLKTHFPAEFMAALLSSEIEDGNKRDIMVQHMEDARRLGVDVLAPDVNTSESEFSVQNEKIVFGLTAIKGVGRGAAEEFVRARQEGGLFRDLFDLCERIDNRQVGKKALEQLIKAGALDALGGHRAQLMAALPRALQAAIDRLDDRRRGQRSLFDAPSSEQGNNTPAVSEPLPEVPAWVERDRLKYEKEVLDFYFSSHPLTLYEKDLKHFSTYTIANLMNVPADQEVTVGGMLVGVRLRQTRKGNGQFAAFSLEDLTGTIEGVIWADSLQRNRDLVQDDNMVIARGALKRDRESPILVISRLLSLEQAARELARELWIQLRIDRHRPSHIDVLAEVLRRTPGSCPVLLDVCDPMGRHTVLRLGRAFMVNPSTYQKDELESLLGSNSVLLR